MTTYQNSRRGFLVADKLLDGKSSDFWFDRQARRETFFILGARVCCAWEGAGVVWRDRWKGEVHIIGGCGVGCTLSGLPIPFVIGFYSFDQPNQRSAFRAFFYVAN